MRIPFGRRRDDSGLAPDTAQQMLANVFIACGREPNSVPLEALSSYSNYRKERYILQRTTIVLMLALFMLVPLLFFAAKVDITLSNPDGDENPSYRVSVSTAIPIRQIQARMDGRNVPIYEISSNEYMIQPRGNGEMNISVTLMNRQFTDVDFTVHSVDVESPKLVSSETDADFVYLYVADNGSGVDYAGITITDAYGYTSAPASYDAETGCIALHYPESAARVTIPDERGNALEVDLKPGG